MRITNRMLTDAVLTDISANARRMAALQQQLSSGKRLRQPADDPPGVERALTYRAALTASQQYLATMESSLAWLTATDDALGSATDVLQRAHELAVQGANDTLGPSQMASLAAEVNQLLEHLVALGNATLRGQRLFAGLRTDTNPFTLNPGPPTTVTYNGDAGPMQREIDIGTVIPINVPGNTVFPALFAALINLRDHLQAGDSTAIRTSDLGAIQSGLDSLLAVRADVGARMNRLEAARERQQLLQDHLGNLKSQVEDADFEQTVTDLAMAEAVYKAGLASAARVLQPSLLDYLR